MFKVNQTEITADQIEQFVETNNLEMHNYGVVSFTAAFLLLSSPLAIRSNEALAHRRS